LYTKKTCQIKKRKLSKGDFYILFILMSTNAIFFPLFSVHSVQFADREKNCREFPFLETSPCCTSWQCLMSLRHLRLVFLLVVANLFLLSAACSNRGPGDWFSPATWTSGCTGPEGVPGPKDEVTVTNAEVYIPTWRNLVSVRSLSILSKGRFVNKGKVRTTLWG